MENYNRCIFILDDNGKTQCELYFLNGKRHRLDKPARVIYHDNGSLKFVDYYLNGKLHRTDGPAMINYNENGVEDEYYYFLLDKNICVRDFETPGFIDAFILDQS